MDRLITETDAITCADNNLILEDRRALFLRLRPRYQDTVAGVLSYGLG